MAASLMAAMAVGLTVEKAMAELHGRYREILKREGLAPEEIAYLRGKVEGWPPGYAEDWAAGYAVGLAKGAAKGVLAVLEARALAVSGVVRERITSCTDPDRADAWLARSRTVERAEDLFAEGQTRRAAT